MKFKPYSTDGVKNIQKDVIDDEVCKQPQSKNLATYNKNLFIQGSTGDNDLFSLQSATSLSVELFDSDNIEQGNFILQ